MKFHTALAALAGFLCISVQASRSLDQTDNLVEGTAAWQDAFDAAVDRVYNKTSPAFYMSHKNDTDHGTGVHERSTAINTVWPSDPGDMHYYATFWGRQDCKGPSIYTYKQWMFISSSCQGIKGNAMSFALKGNLDMCQHFWYYDDQCSDPAELNAVWGDVSCYNGPGDPGKQSVKSFHVRCKDSNYA